MSGVARGSTENPPLGTEVGDDARFDLDRAVAEYDRDHSNPWNRGLHLVGIPLIAASIPAAFASLPAGLSLFALGWGAQFLGHAIEGKKPSFTRDRRFMAVGAVWYVRTVRRSIGPRSAAR